MRRPIVAIALCALALGAPTPSARVTAVRVGAHPTFTRVVFELDGRAGYQIETREGATGRELVVTLQASSAAKRVDGQGPLITRVDVEPSDARSVAHVRLRGEPVSVKELLLANPPRIVLDLVLPATVAAAPKPVEAKPAPAPEPASAKPVAKAEPAPSPAPPKPVAKAEPAATKPVAKLEPKPAAKPVPAPEPKPIAKAEPRPEPKAEPRPEPVAAKPAPVEPAPKPVAKLEPAPAKPIPPDQVAQATPPVVAPAPVASPPGAEMPAPAPKPPAPAPAAKPAASAKPPAPIAPSPLQVLRKDPILLMALGAAGLVLLLIAAAIFVRRRSQRTALDALESQREPESSGLGPFGMDELPSSDAGFDADRERERPASMPTAGPGLFDDDEPEKESEMQMGAQVSSGLGTARAGADSDVSRLVRELEKRMGQLESRLDEANAARERLERQVTAQSEELRVQRAAIARTQRALRGMSRGGEEATEPALRDPSTPSRT